jgi:uncharacterized repeat protein (TIGR03847 family)
MARPVIELNPLEFITIGTIGPKGQRVFYLQAGHEGSIASFKIEKEQAWALGEAIGEFIDALDKRLDVSTEVAMAGFDMDLREPIQPMFQIAQLALSYEDVTGQVVLIAEELLGEERADEEPTTVRMYCSREQIYALSIQAIDTVEQGRPNPRQNGRILYYWQ